MLCIVATVAVHYTHINTCYVLLLLLAVHYTHQHLLCIVAIVGCTLHTSTHAMYCCYCCCTLHTYQHMLCIVAIVGCTLHTSTLAMYCCYCCCTLHTYQHMLCIVAIVGCTHVHHVVHYKTSEHTISCCFCRLHPCRVSYSFLQGLGNIVQENTTADILIEDQLQPLWDMVTVVQERELHTPNS